jgi:hypothetical protein
MSGVKVAGARHVYFLRECLLVDHTGKRSSSRVERDPSVCWRGLAAQRATRRMLWATPTH